MTTADEPVRVLFVLDSLGGGGTERSTALLFPNLRAHGVEPAIVTLNQSTSGVDEEIVRDQGIPVVVMRASTWIGRVRELRRLVRVARPDVVHTALFNSDIVGRLASVRTGAKVVSSLVNTPYEAERLDDPNVRRWKLRAVQVIDALTVHGMVDQLHAVSLGTARANSRALRVPMSRITVIERGRDRRQLGERTAERRRTTRLRLGIDDMAPLFLAVGRQEFQKAQSDLVPAMRLVLEELPEAQLLIAGREGNASRALLTSLHADPQTAKHVRLLGSTDKIADLMVACDALVISSRIEGTAGVALEAMALELPIVATRTAGVEGVLVDRRNALLADIGSVPELAQQMVRSVVLQGMVRQITTRAREEFDERFTIERSAERHADFYREVVSA